MEKKPQVNFTPETLYEVLSSTGLTAGLTADEFAEIIKEPTFPVSDGTVNLINLLAWLSVETKLERGEKLK